MRTQSTLFLLLLSAVFACQKLPPDLAPEAPPIIDSNAPIACNENCQEGVNAYHYRNRTYLWGGEDSSWHFDITGWSLELPQLKAYGYNRETFKAFIQPEYQPAAEVAALYQPGEPVIYLKTGQDIKLYPYILMRYHEAINETADGTPVMIAYCYLADLAAVYRRDYCGQTLTFGVSGYTYADPFIWEGKQGFILWDRDTESLWWPLIDRAVSGLMQNTLLKKYDAQSWGHSTWAEMLALRPDALVMRSGQDWTPPIDWTVLEEVNCN
jgi:hypothetical protein